VLKSKTGTCGKSKVTMSRNTKRILLIFSGIAMLLLMCSITTFVMVGLAAWERVAGAMTLDSRHVEGTAGQIAEFALPAGYQPDYAVNVAGFRMAGYAPGDGHSHIVLMQGPAWLHLDQAEMVRTLRGHSGGWGEPVNGTAQLTVRRTLVVDGETVEFLVTDGINGSDQPFRTMTGLWENTRGQLLVVIEEPLNRWDQGTIDAFLTSIRS
jgi:hypothetical protein